MLGDSVPSLVICSGNGAPCATSPTARLAREIAGDGAIVIPPQSFAQGLAGTGALFHLILGLNGNPTGEAKQRAVLLLGTARDNGFARYASGVALNERAHCSRGLCCSARR